MGGRYKAYPEYKDSGVEWLGDIPSGWVVVSLKAISKIVNGSTPKSGFDTYWDGDIPWVTPADMGKSPSPYITGGERRITPAGYQSCGTSLVPEGSVILSSRAPIGTLAIAANDLCTNQGCKSLVVDGNVISKFLYFVLLSSTEQLNLLGRGSTFLELSTEDLGSYRMALPSASSQKNILAFLDHETAKIDTLIEKQQQLIQLLKEKRQAVISHAVTKGLNPNAKMRDSGVEWLGEVPEHWEVTKLGHYAKVLTGFPFPSASFSHTDTDMKLLRGANVGVGLLKWNDTVYWQFREGQGLSSYLMKERQIVLGMDRPWIREGMRIAKVREEDMPCLLLQRVAAITPLTRIDDDYIFSLLSSELFQAYVEPDMTGVSVPHISPEQILGFQIPLPPTEEQRLIAIHIKAQCELIQELLEFSNSSIELLQERRTALISAAVTGKIDVRDWVPPTPDHHNEEAA